MRLLTILTGILSIIVAVWCFANQGAVFASVAFIIGIMMILQGVCEICGYFYAREKMGHASYIFAEGTADLILGILVLANQLDTEVTVPVFFGMWMLYSGTARTATAASNMMRGVKTWRYVGAVGILSIAAGIYCFFNAALAGAPSVLLISICFIIKGMDIIATGIEMPKKRKNKSEKAARAIEILKLEKKHKEKLKDMKRGQENSGAENTNAGSINTAEESGVNTGTNAASSFEADTEAVKREGLKGSEVHTTEFDWSELIKQGISIEEKEALDAARAESSENEEITPESSADDSEDEAGEAAYETDAAETASEAEPANQTVIEEATETSPAVEKASETQQTAAETAETDPAPDDAEEEARKEKFIRETLGSLFDIKDGDEDGQITFSFTSAAKEEAEKIIEARKKEAKEKSDSYKDDDINDSIEERISRESEEIKFSWMKP